jgi:hypothetical protein
VSCNHCGKMGHMMKSCPTIRCKVCQQLGHMGLQCPSLLKKAAKK